MLGERFIQSSQNWRILRFWGTRPVQSHNRQRWSSIGRTNNDLSKKKGTSWSYLFSLSQLLLYNHSSSSWSPYLYNLNVNVWSSWVLCGLGHNSCHTYVEGLHGSGRNLCLLTKKKWCNLRLGSWGLWLVHEQRDRDWTVGQLLGWACALGVGVSLKSRQAWLY